MAWVDLDDRGRQKETPELFGWATPRGWRTGLRPVKSRNRHRLMRSKRKPATKRTSSPRRFVWARETELVKQIEAMADPLGKHLYRDLLKSIARAWKPSDIRNVRLLDQVFSSMQSAERSMEWLKAAQDKVEPEGLKAVLSVLGIKSIEKLNNLNMLQRGRTRGKSRNSIIVVLPQVRLPASSVRPSASSSLV